MIPPIVISPPFGNYVSIPGAISVLGSFTAEPRKGLMWNTLKSLRPIPGGWVNRIGLRNSGIANVRYQPGKIYSIAPLQLSDYETFYQHLPIDAMVEINMGCPNTDEGHPASESEWERFVNTFPLVIMKLPPTPEGKTLLGLAYRAGVRYFHMCNTIPTERGGESGDRLRELSLEAIEWTMRTFPGEVRIIGGGGIYDPFHVKEYYLAGAHAISLSTALFKPWTVPAILKEARRIPPIPPL